MPKNSHVHFVGHWVALPTKNSNQYFFLQTIFGNKQFLRPGEDDDKLLECLENSDLENLDEETSSENDLDKIDGEDENVFDQRDQEIPEPGEEVPTEEDSDNEPLATVKKKLDSQKKVWFNQEAQDVEEDGHICSTEFRIYVCRSNIS